MNIVELIRKQHWLLNWFYHLPKAILACLYYGFPGKKLTIIGVTGTDGKTTVSTLIYEILKSSNLKTALISTVSAKIGSLNLETGLHTTSPDSWQLQHLLNIIYKKGFKYVVLEATSHGLIQQRFWGCDFHLAVLTNITHEHLDYHKTFKKYVEAKGLLFKKAAISVLNKEDKSFNKLKKLTKGKIITYGFNKADYTIKNFPFQTSLIGKFNLLNCLAAITAAKSLGVKDKIIKKTILEFKGVKGRMEEIKNNKNLQIFIDFAHTPNGLENALLAFQKIPHRKLIAVFGCAGLRDTKKRPMMGKIACKLADKIILTAEDPRTENVKEINKQIKAGCQDKNKVIQIIDRQAAINFAIQKLAKKNDIVVIFGKGHEKSMCFGKKEYPWSDHKAIRTALKRKKSK